MGGVDVAAAGDGGDGDGVGGVGGDGGGGVAVGGAGGGDDFGVVGPGGGQYFLPLLVLGVRAWMVVVGAYHVAISIGPTMDAPKLMPPHPPPLVRGETICAMKSVVGFSGVIMPKR